MERNNKKIKVLFLLEAFNIGGIEKVTKDIVNGLDPDKYDITVQTFWYGGYYQSLVNDNVKVKPFFFKKYVRGIIRLVDILPPKLLHLLFIRDKYDIEIGASDGVAAKVISGSLNKKSKKIAWIHMDVINRGSHSKEFKNAQTAKHIYEKFDTIACVSDSCKFKFIEKFGFKEKCFTVYNPMPVDDIMEKANENTSLFDKSKLNIVCVGRLEMQKGFDRLIEIVNRLKKQNYRYKIHIIGNGTMKDELQNEINKLGLENYIELLGFIGNPYPYINNADLFLLSSRDEAFPLAIGECIILQTPILSTDCSGVAEWFGKYQCGKIVSNDTDSLYHGFKDILDNPSIIDEYKKNIVLRSKEISFQQAMDEFEQIILQ